MSLDQGNFILDLFEPALDTYLNGVEVFTPDDVQTTSTTG